MARDFERRVCTRLRSRYAEQLSGTSDEDLTERVRAGISRAEHHGIELESDINRFLDLNIEYGMDFDVSEWAQPILNDINLSGTRKIAALDDIATFQER